MSHSRSVVAVAVMYGVAGALPDTATALDAFLAEKIKDGRGNICAASAPQNVGGSCVVEGDCGGIADESAFCVSTGFLKGQRVALADRFGTATFDLQKPLGLATAVSLNAQTIGDAQTQLKGYQIALSKTKPKQPPFVPRKNLLVRNTFHATGSEIVLDALKPTRLLVPTAMSRVAPAAQPNPASHAVDHYKCYTVKQSKTATPFAMVRAVSIEGALTTPAKLYDLKKPTRVCVPVVATAVPGGYVEPIDDPNAALLCYQVVLTKTVPAQPKSQPVTGIFLGNRFGPERVDTTKKDELCVPSLVLPEIGCTLNTTRACYEGPAGTDSVPPCHAGTQTCGAGGTFGPCAGQVLPTAEVPGDGIDQDCNGADQPVGGDGPVAPSTVTVDPTVPVEVTEVEGFDGGPARPVTALTDGSGIPMHFVENEVIVVSDDPSTPQAIAQRWGGQVERTLDPASAGLPGPAQYLVRMAPSFGNAAQLVADLRTIEPGTRSDLRVASSAGFQLLAAAAHETAAGNLVVLNTVVKPDGFEQRTTTENASLGLCSPACPVTPPVPPDPAGCICSGIGVPGMPSETFNSDAFTWSYMQTGGPQNIGVGEAWRTLSLAGLLGNKVGIAVIDRGFSNLAVDNPADTGYANLVNPAEPNVYPANTDACSGGTPCPWHGAGVVSAAMGPADDGKGAAGPAGPIAQAYTIRRGGDAFSITLAYLTAFLSPARVINMSFGSRTPATLSWTVEPYNALTAAGHAAGKLLIAAAGNDGADVDSEDCAPPFDDPCWEDAWWAPCENDGVFCIGGLQGNATTRASFSNWGNEEVDLFGPGTVWVGGDPSDSEPHGTSGTSIASPFVAGVAALVMAGNPALSNVAVEQALIQTAWPSGDGNVRRYVNARGAVNLAIGGDPICTPPQILSSTPNHSTAPCLRNEFTVTHSQAFGPFGYQWQRIAPGTTTPVDLTDGDNISGATTDHLVIDPFRPGNAGRYQVVVSNLCGSTTGGRTRVALVDGRLERAPSLVAPRSQVAMAFDRGRGRMVMFGGFIRFLPLPDPPFFELELSNETWERDATGAWQEVATQGPGARQDAFMEYDEARGVIVLFGGNNCIQGNTVCPLTDTWEWDGTTWTERSAVLPGSLTRNATYDSVRQRVVRIDQSHSFYEWDGTAWTRRETSPDPVYGVPVQFSTASSFVLDRNRNVYVLINSGQTWELDSAGQWHVRESYPQQPFVGKPTSGERASMVFDSDRGRILLYSLVRPSVIAPSVESSLWEWSGSTWLQKPVPLLTEPQIIPGNLNVYRLSAAYDSARRRTVLAGLTATGTPLADVFEWRYFADDPTCSLGPPL